jgi:hypothetical protein
VYRQLGQLKVGSDFLARKLAANESRATSCAVKRTDPTLPVSQQCRLLAISRSSVYRRLAEVRAEDRTIMALIDRHYLARPYYGSRRHGWRSKVTRSTVSGPSGSCV